MDAYPGVLDGCACFGRAVLPQHLGFPDLCRPVCRCGGDCPILLDRLALGAAADLCRGWGGPGHCRRGALPALLPGICFSGQRHFAKPGIFHPRNFVLVDVWLTAPATPGLVGLADLAGTALRTRPISPPGAADR